jgi:hypothetical protein
VAEAAIDLLLLALQTRALDAFQAVHANRERERERDAGGHLPFIARMCADPLGSSMTIAVPSGFLGRDLAPPSQPSGRMPQCDRAEARFGHGALEVIENWFAFRPDFLGAVTVIADRIALAAERTAGICDGDVGQEFLDIGQFFNHRYTEKLPAVADLNPAHVPRIVDAPRLEDFTEIAVRKPRSETPFLERPGQLIGMSWANPSCQQIAHCAALLTRANTNRRSRTHGSRTSQNPYYYYTNVGSRGARID